MTYSMTDEDWAALGKEQLLELSDANVEFTRQLGAEMASRGLVTRPDYLTPEQHVAEAQRLLWVADGALQSDGGTIGELAVVALAHVFMVIAMESAES